MASPMPVMLLGQCASSVPGAQFTSIVHDVKPRAADPEKMPGSWRTSTQPDATSCPSECRHERCQNASHQHRQEQVIAHFALCSTAAK